MGGGRRAYLLYPYPKIFEIYFFERSGWKDCTGAVRKSRHIYLKCQVRWLDGLHRCSSKIWTYIFERSGWMVGWTAPVQHRRYLLRYVNKIRLDELHRCSSKIWTYIFERSGWMVGWTAPVQHVSYQGSSNIKGCLPSKVVIRGRSSSIEGHLPSKAV